MLKSFWTLSLRSFRGAHSVRLGPVDQPGSRANPSKKKSARRRFRFLCRLTSWFCDGGARRKCRIFLERGTTHTRGRITPPAVDFIIQSSSSIPVPTSQALERVQRTTGGPSSPLAPTRCATIRRGPDCISPYKIHYLVQLKLNGGIRVRSHTKYVWKMVRYSLVSGGGVPP